MAFSDYSATAGSNTSIAGIDISENCSPANINNALRALMADAKTFDTAAADGSAYQPVDATLTALAGVTTAANKLIYATGADAFATTDITAYGRSLLGLASAAALATDVGAVTVTSSSLSANGFLKLNIGGTNFIIQWGSSSAVANDSTTISYPTAFSSFSRAVVSGARQQSNAQDNNPGVTACNLTSFNVYSAADQSVPIFWLAVGV